MPGRKRQLVKEPNDVLLWYEQKMAHLQSQCTKISALRFIKDHPLMNLDEIAKEIGCSVRTLKRWWKSYCAEGVNGLLQQGQTRTRKTKLTAEQLAQLRLKFKKNANLSLGQLKHWIEREFNIHYSLRGIARLLEREGLRLPNRAMDKQIIQQSQPLLANNVVRFLNGLSLSTDTVSWVTAFRDNLSELLKDVDKITVVVNTRCDLLTPGRVPSDITVRQYFEGNENPHQPVAVTLRSQSVTRSESIIGTLRERGFTADKYQTPLSFEYYLNGVEYLGIIVLWQEQGKPQVSKSTIEMIEQLEPFILFAFSDCVARHRLIKPQDQVFNDALSAMQQEAELTDQERRVVILQVMGHTYQEIADHLEISVETARKHVSNIYRKTKTSSYIELFAKYFSPRLGL